MTGITPPAVAVIGNMNNNGFALMRYFCDLGADARLYAYASDAEGGMSHFGFEADTWSAPRWRPRVEALPFDNSARTLYPCSRAGAGAVAAVRAIAQDSTVTIGSGIAPAIFAKAGRRLSAYYPYSMGVELLGQLGFVATMQRSRLRRPFYRYARRLQTRGILDAGRVFNAEMSLTREALDSIGRPFDRLAIPMVYNREQVSADVVAPELRALAQRIRAHSFVVFSHARQLWIPDPSMSPAQFASYSKHSDWLIRGFADFRAAAAPDAVLCLVEYGPDVEASKALAAELGIGEAVIWLPRMQRREIMFLLGEVDVGVGEFHTDPGVLWGGTGWEIMAAGKPLVQCFNFTPEGFEREFGHPPPPVIDARSPEDVARALTRLHAQPALRERLGSENAAWFDRHNGIGLARRWLELASGAAGAAR